ncbi:unnamed protein product [Fraxinus pennsylvanica]|uniref:Uncharacterized protein n=1 Tax=Fraxinus pennsylvanica TaxID=56036 RepID=A0AAD1Z381_9LAMI|nr:unnamed protein product [Fraxinus pennsylvanica]
MIVEGKKGFLFCSWCCEYYPKLPNLKKLWLSEAEWVFRYGFKRASRNWKKLEELSIGGLYYEHVIFFTLSLSRNYRNLNSLWLSGFKLPFSGGYSLKFDNVISLHIRDLRQLRDLTITGAGVHNEGVETIMANCEKLSRLNLINCARLDPGIYHLPAISVEVKRNHTKWYIDAQELSSSIQELIEQL